MPRESSYLYIPVFANESCSLSSSQQYDTLKLVVLIAEPQQALHFWPQFCTLAQDRWILRSTWVSYQLLLPFGLHRGHTEERPQCALFLPS